MAKHAISGPIDLPLALHRTGPVPPQEQKEEAPPTNPIPRLDLPLANEVDQGEVSPGEKETSGSRPRWMTPGGMPATHSEQVGGVIEPAGTGAGDDPSGDRTPRNGFWGRRVHRRVRTTLTEVTGHGKPPGALMPFTGQIPVQIPVQGGAAAPERQESEDEPARG
jgi:hypothetical protein